MCRVRSDYEKWSWYLQTHITDYVHEPLNELMWMPWGTFVDKSALVQEMAWQQQALPTWANVDPNLKFVNR